MSGKTADSLFELIKHQTLTAKENNDYCIHCSSVTLFCVLGDDIDNHCENDCFTSLAGLAVLEQKFTHMCCSINNIFKKLKTFFIPNT